MITAAAAQASIIGASTSGAAQRIGSVISKRLTDMVNQS